MEKPSAPKTASTCRIAETSSEISTIQIQDSEGKWVVFKFNKRTHQMTPVEVPPQDPKAPKEEKTTAVKSKANEHPTVPITHLIVRHSKMCDYSLQMIVVALDIGKNELNQFVFEDNGFTPALPCTCHSCRQLNIFEDAFLPGRCQTGYRKYNVNEKKQPLVPLTVNWNDRAYGGTFGLFVDQNGQIGTYKKEAENDFWKLVELNPKVRTTPADNTKAIMENQLVLKSYHHCIHLNMYIFNVVLKTSKKNAQTRQFIFNSHHLQFDEIVCAHCVIGFKDCRPQPVQPGLITIMNTFTPVNNRSVAVYVTKDGILEWGIYSPDLKVFIQQEQKYVTDCTGMTLGQLQSRDMMYYQQSLEIMDFYEFFYEKTQLHYTMVFIESSVTARIHWAIDSNGQMSPFHMGDVQGSEIIGQMIMMSNEEVENVRNEVNFLAETSLWRPIIGSAEEKKMISEELTSRLLKNISMDKLKEEYDGFYRFDPALKQLILKKYKEMQKKAKKDEDDDRFVTAHVVLKGENAGHFVFPKEFSMDGVDMSNLKVHFVVLDGDKDRNEQLKAAKQQLKEVKKQSDLALKKDEESPVDKKKKKTKSMPKEVQKEIWNQMAKTPPLSPNFKSANIEERKKEVSAKAKALEEEIERKIRSSSTDDEDSDLEFDKVPHPECLPSTSKGCSN